MIVRFKYKTYTYVSKYESRTVEAGRDSLLHPIVASFNPSLNLIRRTIRIELARVLGLGASRPGLISG